MSPFYARVSPVSYVQADGSLGFGATAVEFSSKSEAMRALAKAGVDVSKGQVIEGLHAEVGLAVYDRAQAKAARESRKKNPKKGKKR